VGQAKSNSRGRGAGAGGDYLNQQYDNDRYDALSNNYNEPNQVKLGVLACTCIPYHGYIIDTSTSYEPAEKTQGKPQGPGQYDDAPVNEGVFRGF
jgi:hypothetical protein